MTAANDKTVPAALLYAIAIAVALLDQAVKAWVSARLPLGGTIAVIPDVFHLTYVQNKGMAFSLLSGQRLFLVAAAILVIGGIIWVQRRYGSRVPTLACWSLALALGGALGNLLDRARLGYVVDMFDARIIRFPIFNVADTAITFGVILLAWRVATTPSPESEPAPSVPQEAA
ncbi:MAG: signal peptidase II [Armatimonadetes bacterium]|nr:signal peptidase II [Armatimonadota bacterium]